MVTFHSYILLVTFDIILFLINVALGLATAPTHTDQPSTEHDDPKDVEIKALEEVNEMGTQPIRIRIIGFVFRSFGREVKL